MKYTDDDDDSDDEYVYENDDDDDYDINVEDYDSIVNPLLPATPNANHWKRTWILLWGGHSDGYTKTEIRASMPHGQNKQIKNLRLVASQYYGNTNYFQPHTEFVLYKYNES